MKVRSFIFAVALLLMAVSCDIPDSTEQFMRVDESEFGLYSFPLDMSDTSCTYTISFYTVLDKKARVSVPLQILLVSPSGKEYTETVYMRAGNSRKGDVEVYRSGLVPEEYGKWELAIASLHDITGFRGIGVRCEKVPSEPVLKGRAARRDAQKEAALSGSEE